MGRGWVSDRVQINALGLIEQPIPLPTSPLKGEEHIAGRRLSAYIQSLNIRQPEIIVEISDCRLMMSSRIAA